MSLSYDHNWRSRGFASAGCILITKLLVSPLISPGVVPYIIPHISPGFSFGRYCMWSAGPEVSTRIGDMSRGEERTWRMVEQEYLTGG